MTDGAKMLSGCRTNRNDAILARKPGLGNASGKAVKKGGYPQSFTDWRVASKLQCRERLISVTRPSGLAGSWAYPSGSACACSGTLLAYHPNPSEQEDSLFGASKL